jgi:hypothetical protein
VRARDEIALVSVFPVFAFNVVRGEFLPGWNHKPAAFDFSENTVSRWRWIFN